jgi:hypothetical protein
MIRSEPEERSSEDDDEDEDTKRSFGYYAAVISVWSAVFGASFTIGLLFLPKRTTSEQLLIFGACATLSTGSVVGFRAWKSATRFAASATSAGLAIVCLATLAFAANDAPRLPIGAAAAARSTGSHAAASRSASTSNNATPANSTTPVPSASASGSPGPTTAGASSSDSPEYLADIQSESQTAADSSSPQTNTTNIPWSLGGTPYLNSIGYAGDCATDSVNYPVTGSRYASFDATVGVNDTAAEDDQDVPVQFTVIVDPGNQQTIKTAQWDDPAVFHVDIHDATMLTLETTTDYQGNCLSNFSYAVWGNARLVPGP